LEGCWIRELNRQHDKRDNKRDTERESNDQLYIQAASILHDQDRNQYCIRTY